MITWFLQENECHYAVLYRRLDLTGKEEVKVKLEKALTLLPKRKLLSDSFCFYLLFLRCFFTSLEMDADNTKTKGLKKKKWKRMYIFGIFARVKYLVLCILLLGKLFLFALLNFWRKWRIYLYSSQKGFYQNLRCWSDLCHTESAM